MSFLGRLFSGLAVNDDEDDGGAATTLKCDCCGREVDANEIEGGECEECWNAEDRSGPMYCCGVIYEDGEDTCRSCGEPL